MDSLNATYSYTLPFGVLLDILSTRQSRLALQTTLYIPAPQARSHEGPDALGALYLDYGFPSFCQIRCRATGQLLMEGDAALGFFSRAGVLEWYVLPRSRSFEGQAARAILPEAHSAIPEAIPVPRAPVQKTHLASLPVRVRQVLLLANGERSLQDIARLLSLSTDEIHHLMKLLNERQLLGWQSITS